MIFRNENTGEQLHATRTPQSNELWTVRPSTPATCLSVSTDVMHQRLGHLHSRALQRFCNTQGKSDTMCTSCIMAKSHRRPFKSHLPRADRLLYRVHSDVVGPFETTTPSGKRYFVTFIDEYSKYTRVYLLARKAEVFNKFKEYLQVAERHTGKRLCILKSDCGGEYRSSKFISFAATHGVILEQGPPHTPEHNSIAERYNRTIMERTRAQLIHAGAPKRLWGEFVMATCHILNLSPTTTVNGLPINIWNRDENSSGAHSADTSHLRVLGSRAFTHIPKGQRHKLDPTAV